MPETTETKLSEDLRALAARKKVYEDASEAKKTTGAEFKSAEAKLYDRMEAEGVESTRVDGTTFSPTETVFAQVQDRRTFVEWELDRWRDDLAAVLEQELRDARVAGCLPDDTDVAAGLADAAIKWTMSGPELIQWKEVGDVCNSLVRGLLDDEEELPAGMGARPQRYISQRGGS